MAGASAVHAAAQEHSAPGGAGSQEPSAEVKLETKLPARKDVPLVFAQDAGEKAAQIGFEERQRRALLYSSGVSVINLTTLEAVLDAEAARRASAGIRVGGEKVTDESVAAKVQEQLDVFLASAPNGDFWRERLSEGYTEDLYYRTVKLVMRLSDMFFPHDPELWPVDQLKAIFDSGDENSHWAPVEQELTQRLEMKAKGQELSEMPSDFVFSYILLPGTFEWLRAQADIRHPSDGLREGVALAINGKAYATADLIEQARGLLTPVAEQAAADWVAAIEIAESDLRGRGKWLSKGTLDALWDLERADYEGTIFTHEQTIIEFLGFPSMEHYRQYFDARQSFRATLPNPFPKDWIQQEIAERGSFLGLGKVQAEVILIPAVDTNALANSFGPKVYRAGADPFAQAAETAAQVAQMLQDGDEFTDLLLEFSAYPPRVQGNVLQRDRGRFDPLTRADLRVLINESDYTDFVQGYSIGDDIFFRGEVGAVYGPVKGTLGYYFYRVKRRDPPTVALDPENDPRQSYQVEDDLLTQRFLAYVNGLREQ